MNKILSTLGAGALVFGLAACVGSSQALTEDDNYVGVCTDRAGNRVEDWHCDNAPSYSNGFSGSEGFLWGYLLASSSMPRYGYPVTHVTYRIDESRYNVYRGGVPSTGGRIDFNTYKPKTSKISRPDVAVNSQKYKDTYINQDSTYKKKDSSKNNSYSNKNGTRIGGNTKVGGYKSGSSSKSGSRR